MGKLRHGHSNLFRGRDRIRGRGLFDRRKKEGRDVWEVESSDEEVVGDDAFESGRESGLRSSLAVGSSARRGDGIKKGIRKSVSFLDDDVAGDDEDAVEEEENEDDEDDSTGMQSKKRPSKGKPATLRNGTTDDEDLSDDEDQASYDSASLPDAASETKSPGEVFCRSAIGATDPVGSTSESWATEQTMLIPATTTLKKADSMIKDMLVVLLENDNALLHRIKEKEEVLCYELHFQVPHCGEADYRPTSSRHRFETIGDFFGDPSATGMQLQVTVPVMCVDRPPNVKDQPTHAFNRKLFNTTHLVVEAAKLDEDKDRWEYCHTRLGNVAALKSDKGKKHLAKDVSSSSNSALFQDDATDRAAKAKGIPMENTLIGEWFKGYMKEDHELSLISVQAWDFDDYCIGRVDICDKHTFSANDEYFPPYGGVQSQEKIAQIIRRRLRRKKPELEPGSGVPFMPTYTLNDLNSKALGLGINLDDYKDQSIDAVVRFVDHLSHRNDKDDNPREALSPPWLPFNAQYKFYPLNKDYAGPIETVTRTLKQHAKDPDLANDDKKAIQSFVKRKDWKLQLWVLPQKGKKMYHFPNEHEEGWGSLEECLDKKRVDKGARASRALYMEAHIVKRDGTEKEKVDVFDELIDEDEEGEGEEGGRAKGKGKGKARDGGSEVEEQDAGKAKAQVQKKGIARKKK